VKSTTKRSQHPGLHSILDKIHRREGVTNEELQQLRWQINELEELGRREHREDEGLIRFDPAVANAAMGSMLSGNATSKGVERFARNFGKQSIAFYRRAQDVFVSSVGIGTYRGAMTKEADAAYAAAVHAALKGGINLIDTSINYRQQRSEGAVAEGVRRFVEESGGNRDEVVVCTKGGYLVPRAVTPGTVGANDVVDGTHSIAGAFLADQINRSRRNLGLETIDVYYLHNPETQLKFIEMPEFTRRIHVAFDQLEQAVSDGFIRYYGTATWDGYFGGGLSLRALAEAARRIAGDNHHFRFVQLPFNIGMREALIHAEGEMDILDMSAELGITVIASASLLQGRLSRNLPGEFARSMPGLSTDAQRAIQFTRSNPGITSALVGMQKVTHVMENLVVAGIPPMTISDLSPAAYR
jgi:aryl-alcohol dehydrogenase-like predicted oxidoreductase